MVKIGLVSDTHGFLDDAVFRHFADCDEIWHAGDFGNAAVSDALRTFKPLRGVYGNVDGQDIRADFPELLQWQTEDIKVMMLHIGGFPPKYNPKAKAWIEQYHPQMFISGHSHILKVMFDEKQQCLHMNPGAAGKHG